MTIDYTIRNSNNRIYRIFKAMKTRCYNKNSSWYKYYGAKGVTICDEWLSDSMKFILWALDNGYEENLTIDRINVDGQYSPNNCRWIPRSEQSNNRTLKHLITYNGRTQSIADWAKETGLPWKVIYCRIARYKWSIEKALTIPITKGGKHEGGNPKR